MTEHSFHGIHSLPKKGKSVTYVSGTICHLCVGSVISCKIINLKDRWHENATVGKIVAFPFGFGATLTAQCRWQPFGFCEFRLATRLIAILTPWSRTKSRTKSKCFIWRRLGTRKPLFLSFHLYRSCTEYNRNFCGTLRTQTRADGNRPPRPDCTAGDRRVRSVR